MGCTNSAKELASQIGCKKVELCKSELAIKYPGYLVGIDPNELQSLLAVEEVWVAAV